MLRFLTPPKQHQYEIRCYIRDPDGHLIEVGQTTDPEGDWSAWPDLTSPRSAQALQDGRRLTCDVEELRRSRMTTAVIGTGGIGSAIARQLGSGGESLRLASADHESARTLAAQIGRTAVVADDNRDALRGADAVVLALRFTVLEGVIDEIADSLTDKLVVVPSNPVTLDAQGKSHASCRRGSPLVRSWPGGCRRERAWPWRSEPCLPISSSPPATGHRSRRCSSTRPMTTVPARKSSG